VGKFRESQTAKNLLTSFAGDEGFARAAETWEAISVSEKQHEKRYRELAANLKADRVFRRDQDMVWRCRNCGCA
jgi:rubrerythrin